MNMLLPWQRSFQHKPVPDQSGIILSSAIERSARDRALRNIGIFFLDLQDLRPGTTVDEIHAIYEVSYEAVAFPMSPKSFKYSHRSLERDVPAMNASFSRRAFRRFQLEGTVQYSTVQLRDDSSRAFGRDECLLLCRRHVNRGRQTHEIRPLLPVDACTQTMCSSIVLSAVGWWLPV